MGHTQEFPVEKMCKVLGVSRSGYYRWRRCGTLLTEGEDQLDRDIRASFASSKQTYGSPRIAHALAGTHGVSKATVGRRMQRLGSRVKPPKRFRLTTQSKQDKPIAANLLGRDFKADQPATKWVSDLSYVPVKGRFVYLTVVLDLADRGVVGWSVSSNMSAEATSIKALKRALSKRRPMKNMIFHSDRGVQYATESFCELLDGHYCRQSMSRKGDCWDNAVAESFFKTIKHECLDRLDFDTIGQVRTAVFQYIEGWYNTLRIHTTLKGLSPDQAYRKMTTLSLLTD